MSNKVPSPFLFLISPCYNELYFQNESKKLFTWNGVNEAVKYFFPSADAANDEVGPIGSSKPLHNV